MSEPILSYQWERKPFSGTYASISGATSNTLNLTGLSIPVNHKDSYRCLVSADQGVSPVYSNECLLYLFTDITITTQPTNTFSEFGDAVFTCSAIADPPTSLYYIWQKAESSNPLVFTDISPQNNTNNTLSLSNLTFENDNGDKYRCRVVASDGTGQTISDAGTLTLPDPSIIPIITITQQPKNVLITGDVNLPVSVSGAATISIGGTPTYTWEYLNSKVSGVADSVLMTNPNWQPIISNMILFNFDTNTEDSGDFNRATTNNGATLNTGIKKYGTGSLFCANGGVKISDQMSHLKFALNSDFTIEGWFYFNSNNIGYQPLICAETGVDCSAWVLVIENNNTLRFYGLDGTEYFGGWTTSVSTSFVPDTSKWYHICVMRSYKTIKIFIDGAEVGSLIQTTSDHRIFGGNITIGGYDYFPSGPRNFNGYIDDVRIVHGKAVYNMSGFSPPSGSLSKYAESTNTISKRFIYDLTVDGSDDITQSIYAYFVPAARDKRVRLKVTYPRAEPVYSNIIRYVFPISGYYFYQAVLGAESFNMWMPDGTTETINGITYTNYSIPLGINLTVVLSDETVFFAVEPPADTFWYNDNASLFTLEYSMDAINWTLADSGGFKYGSFGPNVFLYLPVQNIQGSVYYRVRFFDTWPYDTNNGTDSTPASTYFYPLTGGPINFKINWQNDD